MQQKIYHYPLKSILPLNASVYQIIAKAEKDPMLYQAGQYLELLSPDGSYRPFSIASDFDLDGRIELQILTLSETLLNQDLLDHIKTHKAIRFLGPFGHCTTPRLKNKPLILLAGGVGFSQAKAIIEELVKKKDPRPIRLYWGLKNQASSYLNDLLLRWKIELLDFDFKKVYFDSDHLYVHQALIQDHPDLSAFEVIVSGPKAMVMAARATFQQYHLPQEALFSDWLDFE